MTQQGSPADLLHIIWKCPNLVCYWHMIIEKINRVFQTKKAYEPVTCILGYLDEETFLPEVKVSYL